MGILWGCYRDVIGIICGLYRVLSRNILHRDHVIVFPYSLLAIRVPWLRRLILKALRTGSR